MLDPSRVVRASLEEARARLDAVDALPVGSGHINFGLTGRATELGGLVGLGVDAEWRATRRLSLFGELTGGYGYGNYGTGAGPGWFAQGTIGGRLTF